MHLISNLTKLKTSQTLQSLNSKYPPSRTEVLGASKKTRSRKRSETNSSKAKQHPFKTSKLTISLLNTNPMKTIPPHLMKPKEGCPHSTLQKVLIITYPRLSTLSTNLPMSQLAAEIKLWATLDTQLLFSRNL